MIRTSKTYVLSVSSMITSIVGNMDTLSFMTFALSSSLASSLSPSSVSEKFSGLSRALRSTLMKTWTSADVWKLVSISTVVVDTV